MSILILIILTISLMVFANAFYVATEFATVSARKTRISQMAGEDNRLAKMLMPIVEDRQALDNYIAACQVGITVSSLVLGAYGQNTVAAMLAPLLARLGNFADARISDTLADVVPGYDDQYRVTSPVGSFAAYPPGFHDLGGNVAEWVQDFYAVYPGESERLVKDPAGPASGKHHVVRGSSWRHGNITELRLTYRDYSRKARNDVGFRIARYAD